MNNETIIADAYKKVLKQYRKMIPSATSSSERTWFIQEYPVLDRGGQWNRALYDMNINSWNAVHLTGICLSTSLFVQAYLKDVHNIDSELVGLFDTNIFCHCVIKVDEKYYDVFWPEGTTDKSNLMYGDVCRLSDVKHIIDLFKQSRYSTFLMEDFFEKIKHHFYSDDACTEKYYENLVDRTAQEA